MNIKKLRAVLYTRVSSDHQVDNTSLGEQDRIGREYCLRKGYELIRVFREEGESAKFIDRTMLQESLNFCSNKKNRVDIFLVHKLDRFSRSAENHHFIKAILSRNKIRLESITEQLDDSPSGRLMENVLASFAQFDNEIRTQRAVVGMKAKLNSGIWIYDAPIGYMKDKTYSGNGAKPIIPHPTNFELIRQAWKMLLTGHYRSVEVKNWLNKMGIRTKNGNKVIPQTVSRMFQNRFYAGIVFGALSNKPQIGNHIPMITESEFYRAQQIIQEQSNAKRSTHLMHNPLFPLNKILRCSTCNRTMSGAFSKSKKKRYGYYNCTYKKCGKKNRHKKEEVENSFFELLKNITPSSGLISLYKAIITDVFEQKIDLLKRIQKPLFSNRQNLETKKKRIEELLEEGVYSIEQYKNKVTSIDNELVILDAKLSDSNIERYDIETCLNMSSGFLENLSENWIRMSPLEKNKLNHLLFEEGIYFENGITRTPKMAPIFNDIETIGRLRKTEVTKYRAGET